MRPSVKRQAAADEGLLVDVFAGFGGASIALERAYGRAVDISINHCKDALHWHACNHPGSKHLTRDVWEVEPLEATQGRRVKHAHFSPDCRHFSNAKGGKPVSKRVRSLAWVVIKWAKQTRPEVISLENVREFLTWGPLLRDGKPDSSRKGETFKRWRRQLEALGYVVEYRVIDAADFGAPTHRKRLYLIARCDGEAIVWPEPTHGPILEVTRGTDNTAPERDGVCASNGNDPAQARCEERRAAELAQGQRCGVDLARAGRTGRSRSCADGRGNGPRSGRSGQHGDDDLGQTTSATRSVGQKPYRSAAECIDWTLPSYSIFLTPDEARQYGVKRPLAEKTMRRIFMGLRKYVLDNPQPFIVRCAHGDHANGRERWGRSSHPLTEPLPTQTASKDFALVSPTLVAIDHASSAPSGATWPVDEPLRTVTTENRHALISFLMHHHGEAPHQNTRGQRVDEPIRTITPSNTTGSLISAYMTKLYGTSTGAAVDAPMATVTAGGNHIGLVYAYFVKYFGQSVGAAVDEPMHTVTTKDRFGLVTVNVAGEPYVITDICLRMLQPHELLKAQFTPEIAADILLPRKGSLAVRLIGNSVSPPPLEAIVRANMPRTRRKARAA
jgi:DNA (cytosine-5)-methyltransferase 1